MQPERAEQRLAPLVSPVQRGQVLPGQVLLGQVLEVPASARQWESRELAEPHPVLWAQRVRPLLPFQWTREPYRQLLFGLP